MSSTDSTPASPALSPGVPPRLASAFGGIWRLTWRRVFAPARWLPVGVLLIVLGGLTYLVAQDNDVGSFSRWTTGFFMTALVPIVAFLSGAGAVREGLKPGAVDYLMTRPVPRPAYVVFKYVAQLGCALPIALAGLGMMLAIGASQEVSVGVAWPRLALAMIGGVSAFLALGFLCGAFTSRYLILGLVYAGLIEAVVGSIPIQINRLSILRHLRVIMETDGVAIFQGTAGLASAVGILTLITLILVGLSAALFSTREFLGEKHKDA